MAIETTGPSSRRAVLAAALGGAAAFVAHALGRPLPARAEGQTVVVGGEYTDATSVTRIANSTNSATVIQAESSTGIAIRGDSSSSYGVAGTSFSGTGVFASSTSNIGVQGTSGSNIGVFGWTSASDQPATLGHAYGGNTGVFGVSGAISLPAAPAQTGVYGYAAQSTTANGVFGQTTGGRGVRAASNSGQGLLASATTGTAVYAYADTNGTALRTTKGHVRFSTAGLATILAGHSNVLVTPGFDISLASSKVLAVLQGNPGGSTVLRYVLRDDPNNRFTIQLSANATVNTPVAWFVIS
jgi:hypothetical protein